MGSKTNHVLEHIAVENDHDMGAMLATLDDEDPVRDEVAGRKYVGGDAVRDRYAALWEAFPDFTVMPRELHESEDAVTMQADYSGTHRGKYGHWPPTGRSFKVRIVVVFKFKEDKISSETIYMDLASQLHQLGLAGELTGTSAQ